MMKRIVVGDKILFWLTFVLVTVGVCIFLSASFSVFGDTAKFKGILFNQLVLGLGGGLILFFITSRINPEFIRKYALWFYVAGLVLLALVFVPQLGFAHGGAKRWLALGPLSFQPVELAKYATVIYVAAWLAAMKQKIHGFSQGLLPLGLILGGVGMLLLLQPDTDNFMIIIAACLLMYFIAGARLRDFGIIFAIGVIGIGGLLYTRPYLMDRVQVFLDPSQDAQGSSYQVQQQLIAIGSGEITGRGFGQSIQKFKYLPEPLGDSIYAVAGEEFGFIGSAFLVILYLLFFMRGMMLAHRTKDAFGKLVMAGIIGLIVLQSFLHIASAIAVFPLSGLPLIFISHGGTALAFALGAMGLVLNISRKSV